MKFYVFLVFVFSLGYSDGGIEAPQKACSETGVGPPVCGAVKVDNDLFMAPRMATGEKWILVTHCNEYKVFLSVYYESLCPDSRSFVLEQLQPALQLLHQHIMLQLVPFGKAKSINYGDNGFLCQHGPEECLGNMVQDCALHQMRHLSDLEKVTYVACELELRAGTRGSMECVQRAGLQPSLTEACLRSRRGRDLQLDSEYLTMLVRPTFVPTVTVDALFDQHLQDSAQMDLTGTLCGGALRHTAACARYFNQLALRHVLTYPVDARHVPLYLIS